MIVYIKTLNCIKKKKYNIPKNHFFFFNPNKQNLKTAGYIGSTGTVLTIASLILSSIILLTR